jgi:hypothetical protein
MTYWTLSWRFGPLNVCAQVATFVYHLIRRAIDSGSEWRWLREECLNFCKGPYLKVASCSHAFPLCSSVRYKSVRQPSADAFLHCALVNRIRHGDVLIDQTDGANEDAFFVRLPSRLFA